MGRLLIPLLLPVTLSVSSSISFIIAPKFGNFCPLAWRNSPYSTGPLISWRIRGRLVTIPDPRGKKSLKSCVIKIQFLVWYHISNNHLPTKFSNTEDFPADCPPTTAIWGRSIVLGTPSWVKTSCIRFMIGMRDSIPWFPAILVVFSSNLFSNNN